MRDVVDQIDDLILDVNVASAERDELRREVEALKSRAEKAESDFADAETARDAYARDANNAESQRDALRAERDRLADACERVLKDLTHPLKCMNGCNCEIKILRAALAQPGGSDGE